MNTSNLLLLKLIKCYFRGSLNFSLQPEDVDGMTWDWQQRFLDATINSELIKQYPLSSKFSKLFFKKLIIYLENQEVHDEMYTHLCESFSKESIENSFCYRHHVIGNNVCEIISVKETNKMVVNGTTGMRTWEAALMLADWALCNKQIFCSKKVLELGSGVGFTGVTIAKLCAPHSIYLTDCHSSVLKTICDNIKINFPEIQGVENNNETVFMNKDQIIGAMYLDWNAIEGLATNIVPDIVIGADIVYDPVIVHPLCEVLKKFFDRNKQLEVFIASIIRNEDTFQTFLHSLGAMNFRYKKLPLNESVFVEWDKNIEKCLLQINCLEQNI